MVLKLGGHNISFLNRNSSLKSEIKVSESSLSENESNNNSLVFFNFEFFWGGPYFFKEIQTVHLCMKFVPQFFAGTKTNL